MYAQKRVLNPQIFLEFLCYAAFAALMFYLVSTGKYRSYVTPRMEPYFYFTSAVMTVWALGGLLRLFRPQHKTRAAHCFVLAIPILLLLLPHTPINSADLSSGYLSGNSLTALSGHVSNNAPEEPPSPDDQSADSNFDTDTGAQTADPSAESTDASSISSSDAAVSGTQSGDVQEDASTADLPGLDVKNKKITVTNDDFGSWLSELYASPEKYKGYTIAMTGFVFKDPEITKKDEFIPARLAMTCCVADLSPSGLFCKYDKASGLKENSWVTVEGTIFLAKVKYDDGQYYDDPQISVTKITPAEEVDGYVYPY